MKILNLAIAMALGTGSVAMAAESFEKETKTWREEQERRLKSDDSWLAVVGLHWLKEGDNSVGASDRATVVLPEGAPLKLGVIRFEKNRARMQFDTVDRVKVDGKAAEKGKTYDLATDESEKPTEISVGTVKFFLIKRANGTGVRVKDGASAARKTFKGRKWFTPDLKYKLEAKWTELQTPKVLAVPDVLGNVNDEICPGYATFTIDGKKTDLYPTKEGDRLFFVFKDKTAGKETYEAARFLYASAPQNGKVTLDFNRAVNPPCAFTSYATCPLPPKENRLDVAIPAGELKPADH